MKKRWSVLAALFLTAGLTACAGNRRGADPERGGTPQRSRDGGTTENQAEAQTGTPEETVSASGEGEMDTAKPQEDRAGNPITVPEEVNSIISLAPATTQILCDLGLADKIVAVDTNSPQYAEELTEDVMQFDMMEPDLEQILNAEPDIIFVSNMSSQGGDDIFKSAGTRAFAWRKSHIQFY